MDLEAISIAAAIIAAASVLQSAVGFGMGLFAIPLLLWAGHPLADSVAMVGGAGIAQTSYGTWMARKSVRWRRSLTVAGIMCLFAPIGVLGMVALSSYGPAVVKQWVGGMLLVALVSRFVARPQPRAEVGALATWIAGSIAGVLVGLIGMPGPPLVIYALAHDWTKDEFRGFLWSVFLLGWPVLLGLLAWRFGTGVLVSFGIGLALTPAVWLGSPVGLAISSRWQVQQVQRAATVLLVIIAATSLASPLLS